MTNTESYTQCSTTHSGTWKAGFMMGLIGMIVTGLSFLRLGCGITKKSCSGGGNGCSAEVFVPWLSLLLLVVLFTGNSMMLTVMNSDTTPIRPKTDYEQAGFWLNIVGIIVSPFYMYYIYKKMLPNQSLHGYMFIPMPMIHFAGVLLLFISSILQVAWSQDEKLYTVTKTCKETSQADPPLATNPPTSPKQSTSTPENR